MTIQTVTLNPAFDLHYEMAHFEAKNENYVQSVLCDAGGKGINISRALTVNGVENTAYVILGEENGAVFAAQLERDGLKFDPIYTKGRIRENITLHPADDKETRISLDTFSVTPDTLTALETKMNRDAQPGSLIAFAGRLPRGIEKENAIAFLQRRVRTGARVIVDSNSFTPEDLQRIRPWFIKPNEQEIAAFLGRTVDDPIDAANAAAELVVKGIAEEVMISLGGDGAVWSNGKRRMILTVPKLAHPVSTIGAGDSTLAGLLAATAQGECVENALRNAVAYGTAACMTEGTLPPRKEDIQTALKAVKVTEI
ncbi:MAG: hexose kinase [Clostridia bacterium]|nr:hexose kinase [Clostridia bacterium]